MCGISQRCSATVEGQEQARSVLLERFACNKFTYLCPPRQMNAPGSDASAGQRNNNSSLHYAAPNCFAVTRRSLVKQRVCLWLCSPWNTGNCCITEKKTRTRSAPCLLISRQLWPLAWKHTTK